MLHMNIAMRNLISLLRNTRMTFLKVYHVSDVIVKPHILISNPFSLNFESEILDQKVQFVYGKI